MDVGNAIDKMLGKKKEDKEDEVEEEPGEMSMGDDD